jgi:predicted phosphodiesterase
MKIHFLSDLHNERDPYQPVVRDADLIILAGDIDEGTKGMTWARSTYDCQVFYIAGNHEYYHGHLDRTHEMLQEASDDHVRFLDETEVIRDGIRFLATTGWTDFSATGDAPLAEWSSRVRFKDFERIRAANGRLAQPADFKTRNHSARQWLAQQLALPFAGTTVVITHHAPSMQSLALQPYPPGPLDASFANCWEDLLGPPAAYWIHGHTHLAVDYAFAGTRILSNPRGVPRERTGFVADWVLEI